MSEFHGRRIGKYEILARLSVGGMAELFLAYTTGLGGFRKVVALKQILQEIRGDEKFVQMFLDEARITAALTHSNIGQVFELGEEDGELFLAMEFIAGQNLSAVIKQCAKRQKKVPLGFACRVVRDACLGLHYAHSFAGPDGKPAPVIHRDIAPKNIMVSYSGEVKVIDFGIAKARGRLGQTQVGTIRGTVRYMSPEQVRGRNIDGRSDLFSMGLVLYELLTAQKLFGRDGAVPTMAEIAEFQAPDDPRELNPEIPPALADVVKKALATDRDQRYQTGREMARAIEAAASGLLFNEAQLAAFMGELFQDKIQKTRKILELANANEAAEIDALVGSLGEERGASTSRKMPRAQEPEAPQERRSVRGWLVLVLLLAGAGFTLSPQGAPVRERAKPYVAKLIAMLDDSEPPPDLSMQPIQPRDRLPPAAIALIRKQQEEARAQAESPPVNPNAPVPAHTPRSSERKPSKREVAAQAKPAAPEEKPAPPPPPVPPPKDLPVTTVDQNAPDLEILKTPEAMRKAGWGWLTLMTTPPAAIFDGATHLGTTPFQKIPLPYGTYRLTVIDPDGGKRRMLSAPVKAGQVTTLTVRVTDLPPEE